MQSEGGQRLTEAVNSFINPMFACLFLTKLRRTFIANISLVAQRSKATISWNAQVRTRSKARSLSSFSQPLASLLAHSLLFHTETLAQVNNLY